MKLDILHVYGTLRKEGTNHRFLHRSEFLGTDRLEGYKLLKVGTHPVIVEHRQYSVVAEQYRIDDRTLRNVDRLELFFGRGDPRNLFNRIRERSSGGTEGYLYVPTHKYSEEWIDPELIKSGDWIAHQQNNK